MNTHNDVAKNSMETEKHVRRLRRRHRGMMLYCFLVLLMAVGLLVTLSMTVFFNIKEIHVYGEREYLSANGQKEEYSAEEIVEAAGIHIGDNMVRLNADTAEQDILKNKINLEEVKITKEFPNSLRIDVKPSVPAFNLRYSDGTLILSKTGKVLGNRMDPLEGLVTVLGYDPKEPVPGEPVEPEPEEEQDGKIFKAFMELVLNQEFEIPIHSIDMTNRNGILLNFDHRIIFDMGDASEMMYKITFAEQIISQQPSDKEGTLTMVGKNQCSFRNNPDSEKKDPVKEETSETQAESETEDAGEDDEEYWGDYEEYGDDEYYEDDEEYYDYDDGYYDDYEEYYDYDWE